jgi:hypothetical protein
MVHPEPPPAPPVDAAKKEPAAGAEAKPPTQAASAPAHVLLVVNQTRDVHREIVKLLQELGVNQPINTGMGGSF